MPSHDLLVTAAAARVYLLARVVCVPLCCAGVRRAGSGNGAVGVLATLVMALAGLV